MPNEPEQKCEEGLPPWLATFADLMSLLLTFFVLLLSFANMDIQKFQDMMGSIKDAFGVQVKRKTADYIAFSPSEYESKVSNLTKEDKLVLGMVMRVKSILEADKSAGKFAQVSAEENGVLIRVNSGVMFQPGSATLLPSSYPVLNKVIQILMENNLDLTVRGHTDDRWVKSSIYPSNWELSAARAAAALRYILEHSKVSKVRLSAVGYADTRPLVPNTTEANRAINRRVEFYFHRPRVEGW